MFAWRFQIEEGSFAYKFAKIQRYLCSPNSFQARKFKVQENLFFTGDASRCLHFGCVTVNRVTVLYWDVAVMVHSVNKFQKVLDWDLCAGWLTVRLSTLLHYFFTVDKLNKKTASSTEKKLKKKHMEWPLHRNLRVPALLSLLVTLFASLTIGGG